MSDIFAEGIKVLSANIKAYNLIHNKNKVFSTKISNQSGLSLENLIDLNIDSNKEVNELFNIVKVTSNMISGLANIDL